MTDAGATIGRAEDCDIVLLEQAASRKHATIDATPEGFVLVDLGAADGVDVGGKHVERHVLRDGDVITIGDTTLTFVSAPHSQKTSLREGIELKPSKPTERLGSSSTPTKASPAGPAPARGPAPSQRPTEIPTTPLRPNTKLGDPLPPPKKAEPLPPPKKTELAAPPKEAEPPPPPKKTELAAPPKEAEPLPPPPPKGGTVPGIPEFPITPPPSSEAVALADTEENPVIADSSDEISLDVAPGPQDSWRFGGDAYIGSGPSLIAAPAPVQPPAAGLSVYELGGAPSRAQPPEPASGQSVYELGGAPSRPQPPEPASEQSVYELGGAPSRPQSPGPSGQSVYELEGVPSRPAEQQPAKRSSRGGDWDWDGGAQPGAGPSFYGELGDVSDGEPPRRRGRLGVGLFLVAIGAGLIGGAYYLGFRLAELTALFGGGS